MRIALAQINTTVGDFSGNLEKQRAAITKARQAGAQLVVLPELATCGYPPMDLLERESFRTRQREALEALTAEAHGIAIVTGAIVSSEGDSEKISNAAVALAERRVAFVQAKTLLPTYDVFDESRYFQPARRRRPWEFAGRKLGLTVCEDIWSGDFWGPRRLYPLDPVREQIEAGADLIVTVSASPWEQRKIALREAMMSDHARRHRVPGIFVNLVGGNDELIFDGASFAVNAAGRITTRLACFEEDLEVVDPDTATTLGVQRDEEDVELLERALVLGVRDYLHKIGATRCVVALSGGIDSAVTAHIAERALGAENVLGLLMPGPYSSVHSVTDAEALTRNLGLETRQIRIDGIYKAFLEQLSQLFGPAESYGVTQENLQARVRGTLLMAVSNHESRIVLATGNKSELSVGYTTLYGDLVGGLAVLGDVLKRDVYRLARFANRSGERIPPHTIEKPPSAELAPGQLDSDALPPYGVLDEVLAQVIEQGRPAGRLEPPPGATPEQIRWILQQLDRNEYKRRQAPLVLRVSPKAFGTGRRLPIVHRSDI
ncbi:MAG: NAD+ synthase [Myxococcota bacterium]